MVNHDQRSRLLRARSDLRVWPQAHDGATIFIVEQPHRGSFHRLGEAEYRFLSCLDGATSLNEAAGRARLSPGGEHFVGESGQRFAHWLRQEGLVDDAEATHAPSGAAIETPATDGLWSGGWWSLRAPLLRSRRSLEPLERLLVILFRPLIACAVSGLILLTAIVALGDQDWWAQDWLVLAPSAWLSLAGATLVLKILHELGHAAACRRFGGEVREAGLLFVFFAPLAYVDVSSSWRFSSRWQRMAVAAAGVYVELFACALAFWAWRFSPSGWLQEACRHTVLAGAMMTVVLNLNPLMRFDGYYLLSDLLGAPNLAQRSRRAVGQRWSWLMGQATEDRWEPLGLAMFGAASWLCRCMVLMALLGLLARAAGGLGILAVIGFVVGGLSRLVSSKRRRESNLSQLFQIRTAVLAIAAMLVLAVAVATPWPAAAHSWSVVDYHSLTSVRAGVSGFVQEILVRDGQQVEPGQLLMVLDDPELRLRHGDVELARQQAQLRMRWRRQLGDPSAAQAEQARIDSLGIELAMLRDHVDRLHVRAPIAGRVVHRRLDGYLGTYVSLGSELMALVDERAKILRVVISQEQYETAAQGNTAVTVHLPDGSHWEGQLSNVRPRASRELPHPGLAASVGGPFAVLGDRSRGPRLPQPYFEATIPLSPEASAIVLAGQRAQTTWAAPRRSLLAKWRATWTAKL